MTNRFSPPSNKKLVEDMCNYARALHFQLEEARQISPNCATLLVRLIEIHIGPNSEDFDSSQEVEQELACEAGQKFLDIAARDASASQRLVNVLGNYAGDQSQVASLVWDIINDNPDCADKRDCLLKVLRARHLSGP